MRNDVVDVGYLHITAHLRQAWSFVALMMKSSHSGLEFWNENKKNVHEIVVKKMSDMKFHYK